MSPNDSDPHSERAAPNVPSAAIVREPSNLGTSVAERDGRTGTGTEIDPAALRSHAATGATGAGAARAALLREPLDRGSFRGPAMRSWVAPLPQLEESARSATLPRRAPRPMRDGALALRALWTSVKIALVLFVAYGLMFNFSVVRGSSMAPGIHDGDRILVDHVSYLFGDVHRGDVVVLQYPLDPSLDYIKRVIGLPGDRIEISRGHVVVNGVEIIEPYIASADPRSSLSVIVQPEHFFVLGDNRPHSSDSREFGQVPRANLRGKVDVRVWPPERIGTIE